MDLVPSGAPGLGTREGDHAALQHARRLELIPEEDVHEAADVAAGRPFSRGRSRSPVTRPSVQYIQKPGKFKHLKPLRRCGPKANFSVGNRAISSVGQSACLTSRMSLVRVRHRPPLRKAPESIDSGGFLISWKNFT